jgi:acetylornithine/succinyldiaminopimelate/putrescine aminotransferase
MFQLSQLRQICNRSANRFRTQGLSDQIILNYIDDPNLLQAFHAAIINCEKIPQKLFNMSETEQIEYLQKDILNFYKNVDIEPYVPLSSKGPWIITTFGSVIYDIGSYGMLSMGHNDPELLNILSQDQTMANIMTTSVSQQKLTNLLNMEIGSKHRMQAPIFKYVFLNSGSEAMAFALRLSDTQMKKSNSKIITLQGSFHGRLDRAAQISQTTSATYKKYLNSYSENVLVIKPNNISQLELAFKEYNIEAVVFEPVLGEGCPGFKISLEFYNAIRRLTKDNSLMIVDSVQAGLRTTGYLSVCDAYSEKVEAPDIEVFSKAINGGQIPLSIIALSDKAVSLYHHYIYGNTMCGNPRALDICSEILTRMPSLRTNIVERGSELLDLFTKLWDKYPEFIEDVQGSGLLLSIKLWKIYNVVDDGIERELRIRGLNVIHSSNNSLRFTPNFYVNECQLIYELLDEFFRTLRVQP